MSEPETLYTSTYAPDPSRALDVLAFLLVSPRAFVGGHDPDPDEIDEVCDILNTAKRHALITWYSLQKGERR